MGFARTVSAAAVALTAFFGSAEAQVRAPANPPHPAESVALECLVSGTVTGIAGLIRGEQWGENFVQGCGGGILSGLGKYAVGQNPEQLAWPGKLASSLGNSMVRNSIRGDGPLSSVQVDMGPFYISVGESFDYGIFPERIHRINEIIMTGYELDWDKSLKTGTVVLTGNHDFPGEVADGIVVLDENWVLHDEFRGVDASRVLGHELVHVMQQSQTRAYSVFLPGLNPELQRLNSQGVSLDNYFGNLFFERPQELLPYVDQPFELEAYSHSN